MRTQHRRHSQLFFFSMYLVFLLLIPMRVLLCVHSCTQRKSNAQLFYSGFSEILHIGIHHFIKPHPVILRRGSCLKSTLSLWHLSKQISPRQLFPRTNTWTAAHFKTTPQPPSAMFKHAHTHVPLARGQKHSPPLDSSAAAEKHE